MLPTILNNTIKITISLLMSAPDLMIIQNLTIKS